MRWNDRQGLQVVDRLATCNSAHCELRERPNLSELEVYLSCLEFPPFIGFMIPIIIIRTYTILLDIIPYTAILHLGIPLLSFPPMYDDLPHFLNLHALQSP